jgi:hypothetical protein
LGIFWTKAAGDSGSNERPEDAGKDIVKLEDVKSRAVVSAPDAVPRKSVLAFGAAFAVGLLAWAGLFLLIF